MIECELKDVDWHAEENTFYSERTHSIAVTEGVPLINGRPRNFQQSAFLYLLTHGTKIPGLFFYLFVGTPAVACVAGHTCLVVLSVSIVYL